MNERNARRIRRTVRWYWMLYAARQGNIFRILEEQSVSDIILIISPEAIPPHPNPPPTFLIKINKST